MQTTIAVATRTEELIRVINLFCKGELSFLEIKEIISGILGEYGQENSVLERTFPLFLTYFLDPTKKAEEIISQEGFSFDDLLATHRAIQRPGPLRDVFNSNYYPWAMLVRAASKLLSFLNERKDFIPRILNLEPTGPMSLEVHPTKGECPYRCEMCLWWGGQKAEQTVSELYGENHPLLSPEQWRQVLIEASQLGTREIIFSGGGETLLSEKRIKIALDTANSLGLKTIVYTNGRLLTSLNPSLRSSLLDSDWLRISCHSATPSLYAALVGRPEENRDLEAVKEGIRQMVSLRNQGRRPLKIGIGMVLQPRNHREVPAMAELCSELKVDFLDLRVDCLGITREISQEQRSRLFGDLRELRNLAEEGNFEPEISFADKLIAAMDDWPELRLSRPENCFIPFLRPAIDPFGVVGACDCIGEPYARSISQPEYVLGRIGNNCTFKDVVALASARRLAVKCPYCMPGQISLNSLVGKIISDGEIGIKPEEQPFFFLE